MSTCSFQKYKSEFARLDSALKEKTKENKRLKDNFETLKMANDAQKKEVQDFSVMSMHNFINYFNPNNKLNEQSLIYQ